jgi:hypothetical protein
MKFDWDKFTYDEEWLQAAAEAEERCEVDVEAGVWLARRHPVGAVDPAKLSAMLKMMRLQSILFTELETWMSSWNLGVGLDEAVLCARRMIRKHLSSSSDVQQAYFEALLEEDAGGIQPPVLRQQVISQICTLLTQEDWHAIAQAASQSIEQQVLRVQKVPSYPAAS